MNTALLSYGMSGHVFHAPLINALPEFALTTVMQRRGDEVLKHYPAVRIARTFDEIIGDDAVELVVINTPNETHFDYAMRALNAGKHVVVEKPFTVSSSEGEKLLERARSLDLVLTVFQNRRWDADFLTVKKVLLGNDLGRIVEFEAHYDRFRNYVETGTWKEEEKPGTGILYNLGSHMLDQVVQLFGLPRYVDARMGARRTGGMVDDFYDIRLEYDGMLAIVKSCYLVKEPGPRYIIHGVNGSFVKFGMDVQEQALKDRKDPRHPNWGKEPESQWGKLNVLKDGSTIEMRVPSERGDYLSFYKNLYRAIRLGDPLAVKPEEAVAVIRLIECCYESNRKKVAISLS